MIAVRRARERDAAGIGEVHVAAWRAAYAGILPAGYLAGMSAPRQAAYYDRAIRSGVGVHVAVDSGAGGAPPRIVGFASGSRSRPRSPGLGEGEIETLYVLDDFRELGLGRLLMRAAASHLAGAGCRSAFCWVLRENPSRWFYSRLGGRAAAESVIQVGGAPVARTAFTWDPIDRLLQSQPEARDRESS